MLWTFARELQDAGFHCRSDERLGKQIALQKPEFLNMMPSSRRSSRRAHSVGAFLSAVGTWPRQSQACVVLIVTDGLQELACCDKGLSCPAAHSLLSTGCLAAEITFSKEAKGVASVKEKGTVKWFNGAKGYGFIQRSTGEDVFVHFSAIQENGYRTLNEGETVEFELLKGPKGFLAANVMRGAAS